MAEHVSFVLERLVYILDMSVLHGAELEHLIEQIIQELTFVRELLRDAAEREHDERKKVLMEQVRDTAYDAEDIVDSFVITVVRHSRKVSFKKFTSFFNYVAAHAQFRQQLLEIKDRIRYMYEFWGETFILRDSTSSGSMRWTSPDVADDEPDLFGREEDIKAIENELTNGDSGLQIVVITGMAGTGKTCLAKKIFKSDVVARYFDICTWINASQQSNTGDLLQLIWKQVDNMKGKRYLIVVDDFRALDTQELRNAFLDELNGSRIILTVRSNKGLYYGTEYHCRLRLLSDEQGWELFTRNASMCISPGSEEIVKQIVQKCGGLPLAIVELRNLFLSITMSVSGWEKALESVNGRLEQVLWSKDRRRWLSRTDESEWSKVVDYSASGQELIITPWLETLASIEIDLPSHLKDCLFYFGLLPDSFEITVRRLVALWVAEGFVNKRFDDDLLEKVADGYLQELIDRNMIQVVKQGFNRRPKTCRLPPALKGCCLPNSESLNTVRAVHRFADHGEISKAKLLHAQHYKTLVKSHTGLHSFLSFNSQEGYVEKTMAFLDIGISTRCFESLRVLDLEGVCKPKLPMALGNLINLRYLGLRRTYLETLPPFIGKLVNLQTLDLKHTYIITFPSFSMMQQLRHLFLNENHRVKFAHRPSAGSLKNLQTLWGIFVDEECPLKDGLDGLINLTKLGLSFNLTSQEEAMTEWIAKLKCLQSLRLRSNGERSAPLKPFDQHVDLCNLYLFGNLEKLLVLNEFPPNLTKLTLSASRLKDDPMPTLGSLPNLNILNLYSESYIRDRMVCSSGGFPQLQSLKIWKLEQLEEWEIKEGAMPILKELEIRLCKKLEMLIGLQNVSTLLELKFTNMPGQFTTKVKESEAEYFHKNTKVCYVDWIENSYAVASSSTHPQHHSSVGNLLLFYFLLGHSIYTVKTKQATRSSNSKI